MGAVDIVGGERLGIAEVAEVLVRIGQIASRDQDSLAIQRGVARDRGRLLLLLLLYGGLAGRHTEERAEDRDDTGETMHTRLLFLCRFLHLRARLAAKMRHHL